MGRAARQRVLPTLLVAAVMLGGSSAGWPESRYFADGRGMHPLGSGPALTAYPYATAKIGAVDPWGFVERQCTSYVAWYLNSHGAPFARVTRGHHGIGVFRDAGRGTVPPGLLVQRHLAAGPGQRRAVACERGGAGDRARRPADHRRTGRARCRRNRCRAQRSGRHGRIRRTDPFVREPAHQSAPLHPVCGAVTPASRYDDAHATTP